MHASAGLFHDWGMLMLMRSAPITRQYCLCAGLRQLMPLGLQQS